MVRNKYFIFLKPAIQGKRGYKLLHALWLYAVFIVCIASLVSCHAKPYRLEEPYLTVLILLLDVVRFGLQNYKKLLAHLLTAVSLLLAKKRKHKKYQIKNGFLNFL